MTYMFILCTAQFRNLNCPVKRRDEETWLRWENGSWSWRGCLPERSESFFWSDPSSDPKRFAVVKNLLFLGWRVLAVGHLVLGLWGNGGGKAGQCGEACQDGGGRGQTGCQCQGGQDDRGQDQIYGAAGNVAGEGGRKTVGPEKVKHWRCYYARSSLDPLSELVSAREEERPSAKPFWRRKSNDQIYCQLHLQYNKEISDIRL